ncbi:MAG: hypothetical protein RL033_1598 [Pseudomonadota bacterium]
MTERGGAGGAMSPPPGGPMPPPPGGKPSLGVVIYAALGAVTVGLYLLAGSFGWTWDSEERSALPGSVRQAPGGYRGYSFWHTGYQGGK